MKSRAELHTLLPKNFIAVELGCAEGYFSADLCRMGAAKLYMVDNWGHIGNQTGDGHNSQTWHDKNYQDAMARVSGYNVQVLRGISWEQSVNVPDNSLDLLYIDCCHEYGCVKNDLAAWSPKVKIGGVIAGHDYENMSYGVKKAVHDFTENKFNVFLIPENKTEDAGFYFIKSC